MDDDDFKERPGRARRREAVGGGRRGRRAGAGSAAGPRGTLPPPPPPPPPPPTASSSSSPPCCPLGGPRCPLCGRDLSRLSAARRRGHLGRCFDDGGRLPLPFAGNSPECPVCGKGFSTLESRGSHVKRCAARMAIPPPLLLQAVRQQSSALGSGPPASLSGLKRKVSSFTEQSTKKRKTGARMGDAEEELLVAMAMSRSLHEEEEEAKARLLMNGRPDRTWQGRRNPKAEKKNRLLAPHSPPTLLLQDPEEARRQTEERVALLLSEVEEFPSTPRLPPSRLLELELSRKAGQPLSLPKGPPSTLWERSSLVELPDPAHVCVAGSTLPALPWQTDQSTVLPFLGSIRTEAEEVLLQERDHHDKSPRAEREDTEGCSQREAGALRDLMLLAGEGLTLTQWSPASQSAEEPGSEWSPCDAPRSNCDRSLEKKKKLLGSCSPSSLLGSLAAAFEGMVNNPHLSDVQFQVDKGELFYAHMFVLYARCPRLMEVVDQEGFLVAEGGMRTRRVLLNNVSGEAVGALLSYLYTAEPFVPQHTLSDVAALATRFGLAELAALCASHGWCGQPAVDVSGWEEEERVEKFAELLKSIWVGEGEEDGALLPEDLGSEKVVDEQELEEIYEFAATQRRAEEGQCSSERGGVAGVCARPGIAPEEEAVQGGSSEWKGSLHLEPPHPQAQDARKETVPGLRLDLQQAAEERRPLGAAGGRPPEALLELAEAAEAAAEELSQESLLSVSWGGSLELFQHSCNSREPSDEAAGEDVAAVKSSTPLGLEKGLSRNFSSGDSQVSLVVTADKYPTSPKRRRRGFYSNLSCALFSPAPPQEASGRPCRVKEQELPKLKSVASSGAAAGSGADDLRYAPASLLSSAVDLQGGLVLVLDAEDKGKWPAGMMGFLPKEQEAPGALKCPLGLEMDIPCCQGTGGALLGRLPVSKANADGKKLLLPGTPLLSCRGPNDEQVAKLGLTSGSEAPWPGDSRDSLPTQKSAVTPSLKRPSWQAWLPLGHHSPSPCSSACLPRDGEAAADVVVVEDSEEEAEAAPQRTWGSSVLEVDLPVSEDDSGHAFHLASPKGLVATKASGCQLGSPPRSWCMRDDTPPGGSGMAGNGPLPHAGYAEEERCSSDGSGRRRRGFRDQGDESEVLPLSQRLSAPVPVHKTPDLVCQEREASHTTPPTPLPSYSIMETPELKKELSRFGVRTLPKQQMVLKLKEIFQYTHQRPGSTDETASSQPVLCRGTKAAPRRPTSAAAPSGFSQRPGALLAGGRCRGSSGAGDQGQMAKRSCLPGRLKSATEEGPVGGGRALAPCPKAGGLSGAAHDTSVILQGSSTEFESSVLAEEEEEEEEIPASQSTCREADTLVALRQYIHSRPALCRQILLYQPFELARLQSELKQNGIRIALGRLLEFLDAHCITFTTAETRRERKQQQQQSRQQRRGRY